MAKREPLFYDFRVYVPEFWAFRQKDSRACRKLLEDIAVLDVAEKRVLASRGKRFEAPLPEACFEETPGRTLLADGSGCFLLFPDLCPEENLVLALYFERRASDLSLVLTRLGRKDFSGKKRGGKPDQALFDLLAEVLFYFDGLLLGKGSLPLWTLVLRAANFAGCKLKRTNLPVQSFRLEPSENALFLAFLLCFFLSVRRSGGEVKAEAEPADTLLHVRISVLKDKREMQPDSVAPFLDCKSFCRFRLVGDQSKNAVILPLQTRAHKISSGGRAAILRVLLECDDAEETEE